MKQANQTHPAIHRAALALVVAYSLTTIHHVYGGLVDHITGRLYVPVFLLIPLVLALGLLYRYRQTGSGVALAAYSVIVVVVFGLLLGGVHGGYAHTYKDILYLMGGSSKLYYALNPDEHYPPDNLFFEITGVLEVMTTFWASLAAVRLLRNRQNADSN